MSGLRDAVKVVLALTSMLIPALLLHALYGSLSPALAVGATAVLAGFGGGVIFSVAQRRAIERGLRT